MCSLHEHEFMIVCLYPHCRLSDLWSVLEGHLFPQFLLFAEDFKPSPIDALKNLEKLRIVTFLCS